MFDVGFSELMVCFVVALIVLGPERLPAVARAVGRWTGMARTYMRNLSTELERETQTAELKKQFAETQKLLQQQTAAAQETVQKLTASASSSSPAPSAGSEPPR